MNEDTDTKKLDLVMHRHNAEKIDYLLYMIMYDQEAPGDIDLRSHTLGYLSALKKNHQEIHPYFMAEELILMKRSVKEIIYLLEKKKIEENIYL